MLLPLWKPNKTIWLRATVTNTFLSLHINLARNVDLLPTLLPVADNVSRSQVQYIFKSDIYLWLYRCGIFFRVSFCKIESWNQSFSISSHKKENTHKNPRNTCQAVIYPRFLRNHQALSMLPLLHPWRFLAQQEIRFWGERLAVYWPLDWIAIRSAATPVSNKILINIQITCDVILLILFYLNPQLHFKIDTVPIVHFSKDFLVLYSFIAYIYLNTFFIKKPVKWQIFWKKEIYVLEFSNSCTRKSIFPRVADKSMFYIKKLTQ